MDKYSTEKIFSIKMWTRIIDMTVVVFDAMHKSVNINIISATSIINYYMSNYIYK
jgi:hypothetical protein